MTEEFGLRGPKLPWACPNDRQLALRAKLSAGWSIKTNSFCQYPKPAPLTEREQQIIVSVVKKAEEMDLHEQHRVGKMVDRLESLKKIANGNGVTECVLCGDTFGLYVFGRSNYKCHDCQKAVCRKCVVELSAVKAGIITASSGSSGSGKDTIIRLCKVCSENRELIKKSGAWFYKGVPKYILPEKKNHYTNTYEKYAASPRYQEQQYVSRYIKEAGGAGGGGDQEPGTTTGTGSTVSGSSSSAGGATASTSSGVGTGGTGTTTAGSSTTVTSSSGVASGGTGNGGASTSSGSGGGSTRPVGFFWSRSLVNRSASQQQDMDNDSSSGDEIGGGSLLKRGAAAAVTVAGGAVVAAAGGPTPPLITGGGGGSRHIFGSRRKGSSSSAKEDQSNAMLTPTPASSSNGGKEAGSSWMSLSRGQSPPVSRFLFHRNTTTSASTRSNASSAGSPLPQTTTRSSTPIDPELTMGEGGASGTGHPGFSRTASSSFSSRSGSFRKKSYEKVDFSREATASILQKGDSFCKTDNNPKSSANSSSDLCARNTPPPTSAHSSSTTSFPFPMFNSSSASTTFPTMATSSGGTGTSQQTQGPSSSTTTSSPPAPLGILQVVLLYDDAHQALHCSVLNAKELVPTDINGLADPYCILKLIPARFEGTHHRSKTVHKSVNPVFNETLTFYGVTPHDLTWQTLQILVMDDDKFGKDCLGTTQIALHRIRPQQTRCFNQTLERGRLSEEKEWGRGRLLLSLTYMTEKSLLLVGVIQAQDLPALDHNGTSDPFVKVLLHDNNLSSLSTSCFSSTSSSINRKFKTGVKWRTLNPEFREEFSCKVSVVDLPRLALVVSAWDKDLGKNDDYIGGIVLSTASKGERLKHWLDMIKLPNTKHFKWHTLSPTVLPHH